MCLRVVAVAHPVRAAQIHPIVEIRIDRERRFGQETSNVVRPASQYGGIVVVVVSGGSAHERVVWVGPTADAGSRAGLLHHDRSETCSPYREAVMPGRVVTAARGTCGTPLVPCANEVADFMRCRKGRRSKWYSGDAVRIVFTRADFLRPAHNWKVGIGRQQHHYIRFAVFPAALCGSIAN